MWKLSLLLGVAVAAVAGMPGEAPRDRPAAVRETTQQGLVATLPHVGKLTWRCDDNLRFSTRLTLPAPGASVTVGLVADGKPILRRRRVDPVPAPRRTVVGRGAPQPDLDDPLPPQAGNGAGGRAAAVRGLGGHSRVPGHARAGRCS